MPRKKIFKPTIPVTPAESVKEENSAALESADSIELPEEMKEELREISSELKTPENNTGLKAEFTEDYKFMFGSPGRMIKAVAGQVISEGDGFDIRGMQKANFPIKVI